MNRKSFHFKQVRTLQCGRPGFQRGLRSASNWNSMSSESHEPSRRMPRRIRGGGRRWAGSAMYWSCGVDRSDDDASLGIAMKQRGWSWLDASAPRSAGRLEQPERPSLRLLTRFTTRTERRVPAPRASCENSWRSGAAGATGHVLVGEGTLTNPLHVSKMHPSTDN